MSILQFFSRKGSAPVARHLLQILPAHARAGGGQNDLVGVLREEILAVIAKHVPVEPDNVRVKMERGEAISTLEVEVDIPSQAKVRVALSA